MIGRLRGILVERSPPRLLLEAGGVGYELEAPLTAFYTLPPVGQEAVLYTHLAVREDAQTLYGFASAGQRHQFRSLVRVSGVGARMALAILSGMEAAEFIDCVRLGDVGRLQRIPGIGRKTAERLLVEMRDRLPEAAGAPAPVGEASRPAEAEAEHALIALGYRPADARRHVRGVTAPGMDSEAIIRAALKRLVPG